MADWGAGESHTAKNIRDLAEAAQACRTNSEEIALATRGMTSGATTDRQLALAQVYATLSLSYEQAATRVGVGT